MKTSTRTNATILGALLTLILNSRAKPQPPNENRADVGCGTRIFPVAILRRDEAIAETQGGDVRQRMLGPFASLIST